MPAFSVEYDHPKHAWASVMLYSVPKNMIEDFLVFFPFSHFLEPRVYWHGWSN